MKYLFSFIFTAFVTLSVHAGQANYQLNITKDDVIVHNKNEWQHVTKSDGYDIYIERGMVGIKEEIVTFHAFVSYEEPQEFYGMDKPISALYVYGSLHCGKQLLMMLMDLYVDENNKIVFRRAYEPNSFIVSLNVPHTTRFDILNLVCKESI